MPGYTKLFSDLVTSSIWNEDDATRILWITMLALSDAQGFVRTAPTSLAYIARISQESFAVSIAKLEAPDPESRTASNEGRRVKKTEGGWLILNYEFYRNRLIEDRATVQSRERMRKWRQHQQGSPPPAVPLNESQADADADTDAEAALRNVTQPEPGAGIKPWIQKVRNAHPDMARCSDIQIGASLRAWPKERWEDGIAAFARRCAGANLDKPLATLENHLAGKPSDHKQERVKCRLS